MRVAIVAPYPSESPDLSIVHEFSPSTFRTPTPTGDRPRKDSIFPESELDFSVDNSMTIPSLTAAQRVRVFTSRYTYTILVGVFIIFSMFSDDVRLVGTRPSADPVFFSLSVVTIVVLMADCGLRFWTLPEYRWSFTFGVDLLANLTILCDVGWIWDSKVSTSGRLIKTVGQASRVASRASAFVKIVRFVRMMRIIKMYNNVDQLMHTKTVQERELNIANERNRLMELRMRRIHNSTKSTINASVRVSTDIPTMRREKKLPTYKRLYQVKKVKTVILNEPGKEIPMESRLSRTIVTATVRHLFLVVSAMSLIFTFCAIEVYFQQPSSYKYGLNLLEEAQQTALFQGTWDQFIDYHTKEDMETLTYLEVGNLTWEGKISVSDLRLVETLYVYTEDCVAVMDLRTQVRLSALLNICKTILFCGLLLVCMAFVVHDYNVSVLYALERMLLLVRKIARDPLLILRAQSPLVSEQQLKRFCCCTSSEDYGAFELNLLENTFRKIGVLLALGLGTAGCDIISASIKSASNINPLLPGKKIFAVFCFVSIHDFDKLALDLREDVLLYANNVARMVHCVSEIYQGQINKNLGDVFLLVWKFGEDDIVMASSRQSLNPFSPNVRLRTTLALLSAIKIQAKLAKSTSMKRFTARTLISLNVSVGLHVGWAFEGPIGSDLKIDATYLSPHVNLASRVESAAKIYQVYVTASEEFAYRLDEAVRPYLRHMDTVILKGTETPLKLYCFDMSLSNLEESKSGITKEKVQHSKSKIKEALDYHYFTAAELVTQSGQIAEMRADYTAEFFEQYENALLLYLAGEWRKARRAFKDTCLKLVPLDGPTTAVLSFMEAGGYTAPAGWQGYRVLGSK